MNTVPDWFLQSLIERCVVDDFSGCHHWRGATNGDGEYPIVYFRGRAYSIRRLLMRAAPGQFVSMKCNAVDCINKKHSVLLSKAEYMKLRRAEKKCSAEVAARVRLGCRKRHDAKLTIDKAREIRTRLNAGELQKDLAAEFRISRSMVSLISRHESWVETTPFSGLGA